jgi:hypothetical protein
MIGAKEFPVEASGIWGKAYASVVYGIRRAEGAELRSHGRASSKEH